MPKEFGAAYSQRSLRHADRRANLAHVRQPARMRRQCFFEPDHDVGMMPPRWMTVDILGRQAVDQHVQQLLLERTHDLRIGY